jgi:hypothetical protein
MSWIVRDRRTSELSSNILKCLIARNVEARGIEIAQFCSRQDVFVPRPGSGPSGRWERSKAPPAAC